MNCNITIYEDRKDVNSTLDTGVILESFSKSLDVSEDTKYCYTASVKYFLNWLVKNNIERVNRQVVLDYKQYLKETYTSASTINQYLCGVRVLFQYLETMGIPNVMSTIKSVKQNRNHKKLPLTKQQALQIQNNIDRSTLKGKRDYAIYQLCLRNGLREVELMRANIEDLDVRDNEHILYIQGKFQNEKNTFIVLCSTVMAAINEYLMARGAYKLSDPLFIGLATNKPNTRLTTRSIRRILTKLLVNNNCKNTRVTPHSIRHTSVTSLVKANNNDILQAQIFARHSDINTTTIYVHEEQRIVNAPEKVLEDYLNNPEY